MNKKLTHSANKSIIDERCCAQLTLEFTFPKKATCVLAWWTNFLKTSVSNTKKKPSNWKEKKSESQMEVTFQCVWWALCNHQDRFSPKSSNAKVSNPRWHSKKLWGRKRCGERRRRGLGPVQAALAVGQTTEVADGHRLSTDRRDLNRKRCRGFSKTVGQYKSTFAKNGVNQGSQQTIRKTTCEGMWRGDKTQGRNQYSQTFDSVITFKKHVPLHCNCYITSAFLAHAGDGRVKKRQF